MTTLETPEARAILEPCLREALPEIANRIGYSGPTLDVIELELAAHGEGAHFSRHVDNYFPAGASDSIGPRGNRRISLVYYFHRRPAGFSGGALRLFGLAAPGAETSSVAIEPADNRLVAFHSWLPHEVERVAVPSGEFADSRFAFNCWFCTGE